MNAIIIDDDKKVAEALESKLSKVKDIKIIGQAHDAATGLQLVLTKQPDVLFLDVEMPDMDGLSFMNEMQKAGYWCYVVICTAFNKYLLPALREQAFDFLMKPIDEDELLTVSERIQQDQKSPRRVGGTTISKHSDGKFLFYLNSVDFQLVNISDIGFMQYNHELRVWEVMVAEADKPIRLKRGITNEQLLSLDNRLVQVAQRFIVNIDMLLKVKDNICYFYPPFDGVDYVKIGRFYRRRLIDRFKAL